LQPNVNLEVFVDADLDTLATALYARIDDVVVIATQRGDRHGHAHAVSKTRHRTRADAEQLAELGPTRQQTATATVCTKPATCNCGHRARDRRDEVAELE
jgi:hypothetical protein